MMKGSRDRSFVRWRTYLFNCNSVGHRIRFLVLFSLILGLILLVSRASSIMGWRHDHQTRIPLRHQYTVLINTWKRNDLLEQTVAHYATCEGVDAIRVVWSEPVPPSADLQRKLEDKVEIGSRKKYQQVDLRFDVHVQDNLNNRFKPLDGLRTDAVFSIDDDVLVPCPTLEFAFSVWTSAPDSMVGFVPRMHWVESTNLPVEHYEYTYGGWWSVWWMGSYSMVLSKAAFIHRKYLELYTHDMPASVRNYVTNKRNCEDIAMSFLVANVTAAPPIWVKAKIYEIGSTGISSLQGHSEHRSQCMNHFVSLFGYMPLVSSHVKVLDAQHQWFW